MKTNRFNTAQKEQVYYLEYLIAFCPKYKRKIFNEKEVKSTFVQSLQLVESDHPIQVTDLKFYPDCVVLQVVATPEYSVKKIVTTIKNISGNELKKTTLLSRMSSIWTRNFFVSTKLDVDDIVIRRYILLQKGRFNKKS